MASGTNQGGSRRAKVSMDWSIREELVLASKLLESVGGFLAILSYLCTCRGVDPSESKGIYDANPFGSVSLNQQFKSDQADIHYDRESLDVNVDS